MPFRLEVPRAVFEAILEQARAELPNECCGLLAGKIEDSVGRVVARYPLVNELASPTDFYCGDHPSLGAAFRDMRQQALEVLVVYHSHPTSLPVPSRKDLEKNYYGEEVMSLIISLAGPEPVVRGWWLTETNFREAELTVTG